LEEMLFKELRDAGADPRDIELLRQELRRSQVELQRALEMLPLQPGARDPFLAPLQIDPNGRLVPRTTRGVAGRLGAVLQAPDATLTEQLELPRGQGLVLSTVPAESPAAKAGFKAHDILIELNGKAVPSNIDEFTRQTDEIKPDKPVDA